MGLKLFKRNGVWNYRGTIGPPERRRRLRGSCQTDNQTIAARYVAEIETKYWQGHFDGPGTILSFEQACVKYLAGGGTDLFLAPVRKYFSGTMVKDITPGAVKEMANELFGRCSGASKNRLALTPVASVINYCALELELCPPIRIKRFEVEKKEKTPATLAWVRAFQDVAKPHLGAYALFMFLTGARPSEALAVDRDEDLDLAAGTVTLRETKVSKERTAHLPPLLVATLANLEKIPGRPLFIYRHYDDMKWAWDAICAKLPSKRLTPHCCRHGFATELLRRGVDIVTVAWLGGWETPEHVYKTYVHANKRRDLTNLLADTPLTHAIDDVAANARKISGI